MKRYLIVLVLLAVFVFSLTAAAFATETPAGTTPPGQAFKKNWKACLSQDQLAELRGREVKDRLKVNGKLLKYDMPPVIKEGRTLIPIRAISNGLKAEVDWEAETKTITITREDITIILTLGQMKLLVNGVEVAMDAPAQLISNRTFVPLRFIALALGDRVDHDPDTGDIDVNTLLATPVTPTLAANIATWTAVANENNGYSLRLFRGGIEVANVTLAHGTALSYDFTSVMNISGSYTVKVKALATGDYSDSLESQASLPQAVTFTLPVPAAPTAPVVEDTANTFGWTLVPGFTDLAQYEYSVNNATTWQACTANPQPVGNNSYVAGMVQVRVKADTALNRPAGIVLVSSAPFTTISAITGSIVALNTPAGEEPQVSIMYDNNGAATTVTYDVLSTTQILVNTVSAGFAGLQLNDAAVATLQDNVLIKLEITR